MRQVDRDNCDNFAFNVCIQSRQFICAYLRPRSDLVNWCIRNADVSRRQLDSLEDQLDTIRFISPRFWNSYFWDPITEFGNKRYCQNRMKEEDTTIFSFIYTLFYSNLYSLSSFKDYRVKQYTYIKGYIYIFFSYRILIKSLVARLCYRVCTFGWRKKL